MMSLRLLSLAVAVALAFASAAAAQVSVREFTFQPLVQGQPHAGETIHPHHALRQEVDAALTPALDSLSSLQLYPVAGVLGRDVFVPYFVDLESADAVHRDFRCSDYTFDGHTGHDPYIRSFREQEIGVPVFAPLDATVLAVHDGEPDDHTQVDPSARSNFVVLSHRSGYRTEYLHLKRGSIIVEPGDTVTAGTQIAMIGSSGPSAAPHLHWEVRVNNEPVEPFAGPCRPGASLFDQQPEIDVAPAVIGVAFSHSPFSSFRSAPFDDAPRQATFLRDTRTIHLRLDVANVRAGSTYSLTVRSPFGSPVGSATGMLSSYTAYLASAAWALDFPLTQTGTWTIEVRINGHRTAEVPFRVVGSESEIVNRRPHDPLVTLEPAPLLSGYVPVCRAATGLLADPDTDVVAYRYEWRVNGQLVREVTTAARTDALGRQHMTAGNSISCSVTVSDGSLTSATVTANGAVSSPPRRRSAGR